MADDERPEPRTFRPVSPINPSIPRAQTALQNRLAEWAPTLQQLPTPLANSFLAYNQTRAGYGQYPLTNPQAQLALQAALSGQAQTPNPDPGGILDMPRNALEDIRTITTAIPRMLIPNRGNPLYEEAEGLLNLPENIGKAIAEGDNLGEDIQNLSEQPGIRMLPGAYVAGNLASGNADELLAHPVYTALDVLPFASKFVKGLPVNRAAQAGYEAQLMETVSKPLDGGLMGTSIWEDVAGNPALDRAGRPILQTTVNPAIANLRAPGAFRTALTRKLDPVTGEVVPNVIGRAANSVIDAGKTSSGVTGAMADTLPRFGFGTTGKMSRQVIQLMHQLEGQADVLVRGRTPAAIDKITDPLLREPIQAYAKLYENHPTFMADVDRVADLSQRMQDGNWSKFTPEEKAFVLDYRDVTTKAATYLGHTSGEGRLITVTGGDLKTSQAQAYMMDEVLPDGPEWAAVKGADRALSRVNVRSAEFAQAMDQTRQVLFGVDDATQQSLADLYTSRGMQAPVPPVPATRMFLDELDQMKLSGEDASLARQFRLELNKINGTSNPRVAMEGVIRARRYLSRMRMRRTFQTLDMDLVRAEINDATRWTRKAYKNGSFRTHLRSIAKAEARLDKAVLRALPARLMPNAHKAFDEIVKAEIDNPRYRLSDAEKLEAHTMIDEGVHQGLASIFGDDGRLMQQWQDDAAKIAMDGKMSGALDPVFMHHVEPKFAASLNPRISERLMNEGQTKARTWDVRPYVGSPSVALDHQMMELVGRRGSEEVVETVGKAMGETEAKLIADWHAKTGDLARARQIVQETTAEWPPPNWGGTKSKVPNSAKSDPTTRIRVPKELVDTLSTINNRSQLNAIFDPVMRVFRTAVLPLSARFQVYNVMGGAMSMSVMEPLAWRQFFKARTALSEAQGGGGYFKALKDSWDQTTVPRESATPIGSPSTGAGASGYMVSEQMLTAPKSATGQVAAIKSWMQGQKMRELLDQAAGWKDGQPGGKTPFGRFIDGSWTSNEFVDNMYRTMTSIEAYERAIKSGKSVKAAELDAIRGVRSVAQSWDQLLPLERQVLRSVFPFYSFARFATGMALRYPFDHPFRASVMASFARAELEDQGSGLPRDFLGLFQLNQMDEDGNAKFLRLSGFNPFRDTTDWFSVAGFVGQTNPFISATLQSLGVNPMSGGPQLYPNLQFDPETGGLKADTPGFAGALVTSMLPQARIIHNLVIGNEQWDELVQRDPESARRQLQGQLGLPVMTQVENLPQEQIRAEMNRYQMFTDARQEAVKDGKLQELYDTYGDLPINADGQVLSAYIDQLGQLEAAGLLEPLRPQTDARSPAELVRSFGGINRPGPTQ